MKSTRELAAAAVSALIVAAFIFVATGAASGRGVELPSSSDAMVPFRPVVWNPSARDVATGYVVDEGKAEPGLLKNVAFVLKHYGVRFRWDRENLLVSEGTWADRELMANVTSKARDPAWLKARGGK
jgi:hypothetical protein